ncbi:MAG: hypothetical protein Q9214_005190, partial [Letrouitia sp. 1 TL-2023]
PGVMVKGRTAGGQPLGQTATQAPKTSHTCGGHLPAVTSLRIKTDISTGYDGGLLRKRLQLSRFSLFGTTPPPHSGLCGQELGCGS